MAPIWGESPALGPLPTEGTTENQCVSPASEWAVCPCLPPSSFQQTPASGDAVVGGLYVWISGGGGFQSSRKQESQDYISINFVRDADLG